MRTKEKGDKALSYNLDDNNNKVIPIAELERVFPKKYNAAIKRKRNTNNTSTEYSAKIQKSTAKNTNNTIQLEQDIKILEQQIEFKDELLRISKEAKEKAEEREQDLSKKLNLSQETLKAQTAILEDLREKKQPQKPVQEEKQNFDRREGKNRLKTLTDAEIAIIILLSFLCGLIVLTL
ncbi:hypothetical protein [Aquimarina longa]|uniref:hypothetical protein n=1 Tax=Aquimarina longa TaxID=1080221 RepID=UPI0011DF45BD|nr:hypothetical protein [Aquimarina longa]